MGFMNWRTKSAEVLQQGGVIGPDERLPWPQTAVMGVQHVIAMFGATVLAPILMGFDPNVAILMSGALGQAIGTGGIERFMPPVVTGSVVAVIGLNLAGIPIKNMAASNFDSWMQVVTFVSVGLVAVLTRGMVQRLLILVGLIVASIIYAVLTNGLGLGKPMDLSALANAAWFGLPNFAAPVFEANAMLLIAP